MGNAGRENDLSFQGEQLGTAKMRAEQSGNKQRSDFTEIARQIRAFREGGIAISPLAITFTEPVDQAAWEKFVSIEFTEERVRGPLDPPEMPHEDQIVLKAVQ